MGDDRRERDADQGNLIYWNRLAVVGIGSFLWGVILNVVTGGDISLLWPIVLMLWIAMGSNHLVNNVGGFDKKLGAKALLFAGVMSPAWPWLK